MTGRLLDTRDGPGPPRSQIGGLPLYLCAERIGVSYSIAVYKARELNLAQRLNRGRRPGQDPGKRAHKPVTNQAGPAVDPHNPTGARGKPGPGPFSFLAQ